MEDIIEKIRNELKHCSDEKTKAVSRKFFKEKILFHGVRVSTVTKISKDYFKMIDYKLKPEIFDLSDSL